MTIGDKILLYKERLNFGNFQEFGKAVGVSGDWLRDLSKKTDVKSLDLNNVIKLCDYLNITVDQLLKNDKDITPEEINNIDDNDCNDIGLMIDKICSILDKEENIKMYGINLNKKAKETCIDALEITKMFTRQYI